MVHFSLGSKKKTGSHSQRPAGQIQRPVIHFSPGSKTVEFIGEVVAQQPLDVMLHTIWPDPWKTISQTLSFFNENFSLPITNMGAVFHWNYSYFLSISLSQFCFLYAKAEYINITYHVFLTCSRFTFCSYTPVFTNTSRHLQCLSDCWIDFQQWLIAETLKFNV